MKWENVSKMDDNYFDRFEVMLHISDFGIISTSKGPIKRNIAEEFQLKVISCHYGDNSNIGRMNPTLEKLVELIETRYGFVDRFKGTLGFSFNIEYTSDKGDFIYFLAAGNNGQELSTGLQLETLSLLDDQVIVDKIKEIDEEMYQLIEEAGVSKFK